MKAIYSRYGSIQENDSKTLAEAKSFLDELEWSGDGYAIGIYDEESKTAYVKENMKIAGRTEEDVFNEKMEDLKELGIDPLKIKFFQ